MRINFDFTFLKNMYVILNLKNVFFFIIFHYYLISHFQVVIKVNGFIKEKKLE